MASSKSQSGGVVQFDVTVVLVAVVVVGDAVPDIRCVECKNATYTAFSHRSHRTDIGDAAVLSADIPHRSHEIYMNLTIVTSILLLLSQTPVMIKITLLICMSAKKAVHGSCFASMNAMWMQHSPDKATGVVMIRLPKISRRITI